jgi:hypothetical protein
MNRAERKTRKHFGQLSCEWCGKWTHIWKGVPQTEQNLRMWHDKREGKQYYCKRPSCKAARSEYFSDDAPVKPKRVKR